MRNRKCFERCVVETNFSFIIFNRSLSLSLKRDLFLGLHDPKEMLPEPPINDRYWFCRIRQAMALQLFLKTVKTCMIEKKVYHGPIFGGFVFFRTPKKLEDVYLKPFSLREDDVAMNEKEKEKFVLPHFCRVLGHDEESKLKKNRWHPNGYFYSHFTVHSVTKTDDTIPIITPTFGNLSLLVDWMKELTVDPEESKAIVKALQNGKIDAHAEALDEKKWIYDGSIDGAFRVLKMPKKANNIRIAYTPVVGMKVISSVS